ncbi:MAG: DUF58 domain-containing protein [Kiritimatiellae bacterium]|nr:DUF58 domain-containing protein [Kiritimatiellia bacterium]
MLTRELIRKIRRIEITTNRVVSDLFAGEYRSVFKGRGIEFQEVREYLPGDDVRLIDWNVTARMGQPYIKKFTEERELTVMLLVDVSASLRFGCGREQKKNLLAEMAAVLAFSAVRNDDRVGLILFSSDIECYVAPRKGVGHVLRVVREVLFREPRRRGTAILAALNFLNHVMPRRTVAFLMSDFLDSNFEHGLATTARRHDLIGVIVGHEREWTWPAVGLVEWEDLETGRRLVADTASRRVREWVAAQRESGRARLRRLMRLHRVDRIEVTAGQPYERELARFFAERRKRYAG